MISDVDLQRLKDHNPCTAVAQRYVKLRAGGKGLIGPCPACSENRQNIAATKFECWDAGWTCAGCNQGGDVIRMVQLAEQCDFIAAIGKLDGGAELLNNPARPVDPEAERRAAEARDLRQREQQEEQNEFREGERRRAWDLWERGRPVVEDSAGWAYLVKRGLDAALICRRLRFDATARFYVQDRPKARLIHEGPALLACIVREGHFYGLHRTFIDLSQPKGKARIVDPKDGGEPNAKKVRGSKKGGHIVLLGPPDPRELYLGEGVEKVGAVATAFHAVGRELDGKAFWTSIDLQNIGGKAKDRLKHPSRKGPKGKQPLHVQGIEPDMAERAIEIPDSVERLVLLADSTSERFETQCVMVRAAARYARPGRTIVAAWPPAGIDFDEMLTGASVQAAAAPSDSEAQPRP